MCQLTSVACFCCLKQLAASGQTLAMIWDMHQKGGPAVDVLQQLGIKRAVDALNVLYQLRVLCRE